MKNWNTDSKRKKFEKAFDVKLHKDVVLILAWDWDEFGKDTRGMWQATVFPSKSYDEHIKNIICFSRSCKRAQFSKSEGVMENLFLCDLSKELKMMKQYRKIYDDNYKARKSPDEYQKFIDSFKEK